MDGILNLAKPSGPTSHDVVAQVRRFLKEKRVGHAGTLDPLATGVLVIAVGKATRILEYLVAQEKEYRAEMVLGRTTSTEDSAGNELTTADASHITREMVEAVIPQFTGKVMQVPPMVSAVKHEGKRLYKLARKDIVVERQPREISIYELEITSFTPGEHTTVGLRVVCSSGTYIRTLCADIGAALGVGGYMQSLVRTRVGRFCLENSIDLQTLDRAAAEGFSDRHFISMDEALFEFPAVQVDADQESFISNGREIQVSGIGGQGSVVRIKSDDGNLLAIGRIELQGNSSIVKPEKVFMEAGS